MAAETKLSASLEDYLEAIYQVIAEKQLARPKDLAIRLQVAPSSVTHALQALVSRGLVEHAPYEAVTLTEQGEKTARVVVHRHEVLTEFFSDVLAVDAPEAAECACRVEHAISDTVLERLVEFINYEKRCHHGGATWVEGKGFICHSPLHDSDLCGSCADKGFCTFLGDSSDNPAEAST